MTSVMVTDDVEVDQPWKELIIKHSKVFRATINMVDMHSDKTANKIMKKK